MSSTLTSEEYILYSYKNAKDRYFRSLFVPKGIIVPENTYFSCFYPDGYIELKLSNDEAATWRMLVNVRVILPTNRGDLLYEPFILSFQQGRKVNQKIEREKGFYYPTIENGYIVVYASINIAFSSSASPTFYIGMSQYGAGGKSIDLPDGYIALVNYRIHKNDKIPIT